jgi:amino acid permease
MFVMAYGAMLTYLMIVKDTYATVLLGTSGDESVVEQKRAVLFLVSLCIMVPLSSQRDMAGASSPTAWGFLFLSFATSHSCPGLLLLLVAQILPRRAASAS